MVTVIGLTGGIASGKSTVSSYLRDKGMVVLDADQLVHDLQAPAGRLYQALVDYFGADILQADQTLDRTKLGQLIFSNPEMMAVSNALQDEIIREELARQLEILSVSHSVIFLDIPLLFEKGYETWCQEIWLVVVSEAVQAQRLMARNGYSQAEAQERIASQWPLLDKMKKSQVIIDNNNSLQATYQQVEEALRLLER
ncbi:dephospho-CoA kinase [Streptococcus cuniculipharyngis]|uniref:Dephospho-CoA kinase n=1 Tax=Streptococcus cuniculipharyngis TaxID=1562651 RepID=A0A5C5SG13_9STRE|nr:dephospho-CoA kinase [Streptococcus cuniculipharyngis]TWS99232.1 dephospho-CoA kinase [Streptococcus cuniculipharyngis]